MPVTTAPDTPLANRTVLATADPMRMHSTVASFFREHRLRCLDVRREVNARLNRLPLRDVSLFYMHYGSEVLMESGRPETFYVVHVNLAGSCDVTFPQRRTVTDTRRGVICSPSRPVRFGWQAQSRALVVRIDKAALDRHFQQITGLPLQRDIDFEIDLDLGSPAGQRWLSLLRFIQEDAAQPDSMCSTRAGAVQFEQLVMSTLLVSQPGTHHDLVARAGPSAAPRYVKRAEAFMLANLHRAATLEEIAAHAAVSARSLTNAFGKERGASPMAYYTNLRLARVHDALSSSDPGQTVTGIAHAWGFHHLSGFAALYRRRYGVPPSETLRRNPG